MLKLNVHQAKTHLSRYLELLVQGEVIILCKRNKPIAEIRGLPKEQPTEQRPIGLEKGSFEVSEEFFEPLPEEFLSHFS